MTVRLGIDIAPHRIRAVRRRAEATEMDWDGETPEAVAALKERLGTAGAVAVTVDVASLLVKRVKLPPLPLAERRRILSLEPERFFPVRGEELVVSVREEDDLIFAAPEEHLDGWISAFESLGPVEPPALAGGMSLGEAHNRNRQEAPV